MTKLASVYWSRVGWIKRSKGEERADNMNEATRQYIRQHLDDDIRQLALRGTKDPEVDLAFALQQIDGHKRAKEKLPSKWLVVGSCLLI